jgi:hypothetical protein
LKPVRVISAGRGVGEGGTAVGLGTGVAVKLAAAG